MKTVPLGGALAAGRVALVDDADYATVMAYRWHVVRDKKSDRVYALTNLFRDGRRTTTKMHTLLTGWPCTDHVDHDGLNNQRVNLRPVTNSQNLMNSRHRRDSQSSRFKGVYHRASFSPRYRAYIRLNGDFRDLGWFDDEISAALAYDAAARELFGPYARPNFPESFMAAHPPPQPHKPSSAYRGVSRYRAKWRARIGGRVLGYFTDEEAAARAYDAAAIATYGEFAKPNFH